MYFWVYVKVTKTVYVHNIDLYLSWWDMRCSVFALPLLFTHSLCCFKCFCLFKCPCQPRFITTRSSLPCQPPCYGCARWLLYLSLLPQVDQGNTQSRLVGTGCVEPAHHASVWIVDQAIRELTDLRSFTA